MRCGAAEILLRTGFEYILRRLLNIFKVSMVCKIEFRLGTRETSMESRRAASILQSGLMCVCIALRQKRVCHSNLIIVLCFDWIYSDAFGILLNCSRSSFSEGAKCKNTRMSHLLQCDKQAGSRAGGRGRTNLFLFLFVVPVLQQFDYAPNERSWIFSVSTHELWGTINWNTLAQRK